MSSWNGIRIVGSSRAASSGRARPLRPSAAGRHPHPKNGSTPYGTSPLSASPGPATASVNRDFRDLLAEFNAHGVEYLVVGAHALAAHGHVRATKDLDVWVRPASDNAERVLSALRAFGAPLHDLTQADLAAPGLVFQIGVAPLRIDIMTSIDGVEF